MGDDWHLEVYKQYRAHQSKYCYFLLAVAAACVALCVKRTTGMTLDRPMILLGVAIACWVISFGAGCRMLQVHATALNVNLDLFRIQQGHDPRSGADPGLKSFRTEELNKVIDQQSNKGVFLFKVQTRSLVLGAGFFIAWHIINMALTAQP